MPTSTLKSVRDTTRPLSDNKHLLKWVEKMARLTQPAAIHWVDGSREEYDALCAQLVEGGTFIKLNEKLWPGCYYARSDATVGGSNVGVRARSTSIFSPMTMRRLTTPS